MDFDTSHATKKPQLQDFTDTELGLSEAECSNRLAVYGYNEFCCQNQQTMLSKYLEQFNNPLIQLLLVSVFISLILSQYDDAISISMAVLIVTTVACIQEYRSELSLKELNKLVPPSCKAIRDGKVREFLARELVPGDLVLMETGDRVPADLRLIHAQDLSVDESNLTGETESVHKTAFQLEQSSTKTLAINNNNNNHDTNSSIFEEKRSHVNVNMLNHDKVQDNESLAFMGTLVQSGNGKGIVCATGDKTSFGSVFRMMQFEQAPRSPLQLNMDELGKQLSIYSICLITIIVIIGWSQSRPIMEMFTIGVSLAVAAIPEGLPIVVTVTLALGVTRMAKRKAIVKKLPAVESVGCLQVLCCDKTGTLTMNQMTVTNICTSELFHARVSGIGYDEIGDIFVEDLTVMEQRIQLESIDRLLKAGAICNNSRFDPNGKLIGQATEGAILAAARKAGLINVREEYERLEEKPFNSRTKYMAIKCKVKKPKTDEHPQYYVKGAIETILERCTTYSAINQAELLDESKKKSYIQQAEYYEHQGLRVLAIASGTTLDTLTFLGFCAIHDAPKKGVEHTISVLQQGGICVKMITGDSKFTALAVAKSLGINNATNNNMSGQELESIVDSNKPLSYKADKICSVAVFYRTTPVHKVIIVKILQSAGYIVGMTGDGVNDGAALKKANIGIAMGKSGTDVCKEAADVILMDDDLGTITVALEEGKGIYYNIRNFIRFQLSTSIAALSLITLSTILNLPNPLNAMQILYINILMDGPPAQSLGVEPVDQEVLKQPPRNVKEPVLTVELLLRALVSALIILGGTMLVFVSEMSDGLVTPRDTTMTFTCFVFFDLFNALSCRSQKKSIFEIGFFSNKAFLVAAGLSILGQMLVIYLPPFQRIFLTEALSLMDIIYLISIASTVFITSELLNQFTRVYSKRKFRRRLPFDNTLLLV